MGVHYVNGYHSIIGHDYFRAIADWVTFRRVLSPRLDAILLLSSATSRYEKRYDTAMSRDCRRLYASTARPDAATNSERAGLS